MIHFLFIAVILSMASNQFVHGMDSKQPWDRAKSLASQTSLEWDLKTHDRDTIQEISEPVKNTIGAFNSYRTDPHELYIVIDNEKITGDSYRYLEVHIKPPTPDISDDIKKYLKMNLYYGPKEAPGVHFLPLHMQYVDNLGNVVYRAQVLRRLSSAKVSKFYLFMNLDQSSPVTSILDDNTGIRIFWRFSSDPAIFQQNIEPEEMREAGADDIPGEFAPYYQNEAGSSSSSSSSSRRSHLQKRSQLEKRILWQSTIEGIYQAFDGGGGPEPYSSDSIGI